MSIFIKFKILERINLAGKKKCTSVLLYYNDFVEMETDFDRNRIRIKTKTDIIRYNDVILKSLEIKNENGVKI